MSTAFPSALDTATTLYDVVNNAQAVLSAGYTAGGTTLDLDSGSLFPSTGGIVYVGNERTTYTGKTSNQLTGVAALGSNYPSGTAVAMYFDADHIEVLRDAIIATQARVGVTGDTTAGTLTKRIADLEAAGAETITISGKTGAYTIVAGDLGTIIRFTGTGAVTCSFDAAATLGSGFNCWIVNDKSTGVLTLDPSGSETIQLATTATIPRGEGVQVFCDGTNLQFASNRRSVYFQIDNANSAAQPASATATGAIALGSATASGSSAIAISGQGTLSVASSTYAFALGSTSGGGGSQAVTGAGAMALGGSYASGADALAAAIGNNTSSYGAQGANAIAHGYLAKATGAGSSAYGKSAWATGAYSIAICNLGTAIGFGCLASATNSVAIGDGALAATVYGKLAYTQVALAAQGDTQTGLLVLAKGTTDATATGLSSNGSAAGAANQLILPSNSAFAFDGIVVARQQAADGTASAAWKVEGLIRREGTAGSTTLVASTVTAISNVPGWTLALSADTTNGGLAVTFTGAAATDIRTVANLRTVEVTYA